MKKVIVLGGGVAGLSAAHELAERGFEVEVFERQPKIPGGKARSVSVPDTAVGGRKDLPGEHGFRFFPGFYKHVTDTMSRIPYKDNKNGVLDNLVPTQTVMMARDGKSPIVLPDDFPTSLNDLILILKAIFTSDTGLTDSDITFFATRIWQLMTSCHERRLAEYESIGWWEYLEADSHSEAYRNLFVLGLTRSLVAAKAEEASTRTVGDIFLQLIYNMIDPFVATDRVLNGPTNEVWIDPWLTYLTEKKGVKYHFEHILTKIHLHEGKISGVEFDCADGSKKTITEDAYYIAAIPVERLSPFLTHDFLKADQSLASIKQLAHDVNWMNGIQFYLNEFTPINKGHIIYTDSQWALTSISQKQFWKNVNLADYGDGTTKEVLSVDISDWDAIGTNGKTAKNSTKEEVKEEVWLQLKKALNVDGKVILKDEMLNDWYLDSDIVFKPFEPASNEEPLLVNKVNSWTLRPEAYTRIPNLFLAADYVRTYTDLATMEGANEAARRAVNCIIDQADVPKDYCEIWNLHNPAIFVPFRWHDRARFDKGLPWEAHIPWFIQPILYCIKIGIKIINWFLKLFK